MVIPALASALVLAVVGGPRTEPASGIVGGWQSPATRCEVMAGSLRIAPALHDVVADLCRRSPTFRRQVARLADADGLTVTVRLGAFQPTSSWRAQTVITQVGGHVRSADVQVPAGDGRLVAELIAHEFEHILEQLDGLNLRMLSNVRGSGVRESSFDVYETTRAQRVGRIVAAELSAPQTAD